MARLGTRGRLLVVAALLVVVGAFVLFAGQGDAGAAGAVRSTCDILESVGRAPTAGQAAECARQADAGSGKQLVGGVVIGLGVLAGLGAFVVGRPEGG